MTTEADTPLRHLSLCTGYGGLDLAVHAVIGGELVAVAEFDKHAAKICEARFDVPNLGDITALDWHEVGETYGPIDIITAGYPCQPFSFAGKRKGTSDARHIWPHIAEAVRTLRPRLVVLENVYGHLSKGFAEVQGALAAARYDATWTCLRAGDVGAPHQRERVFVVAADTDRARLEGRVRPEPERGRERVAGQGRVEAGGNAAPADTDLGTTGGDSRDAFGPQGADGRRGEEEVGDGPADETRGRRSDVTLLPKPTANEHTGPGHAAQGGKNLRTEIALLPTPTAAQTRNATSGRREGAKFNAGTTLQDVAYTGEWGKYEPAIQRWEAMTRPAPPPSEPKENGEGARLSPCFVEWMMGLPDGWVTDVDISRSHQLKALGNGVVPQQAYVALTVLMERVRW